MHENGLDNKLQWSVEKSALMRRKGEAAIAMETDGGVRQLEREVEAVVLGKVQTMLADEQDKLLQAVWAMQVVLG